MKRILATVLVALPVVVATPAVHAAGADIKLEAAPIDLGNKRSLQRGARSFVNYCLGCHSMKYLRYSRMAEDLDLSEEMVAENLMFTGEKVGGTMQVAMPADQSKGWFGSPPPDLTLTARARGSDWLYTYLLSFYKDDSRDFGVNNVVLENAGMPHVLEGLQGLQERVDKHHDDGVDKGEHHVDGHGEVVDDHDGHTKDGVRKVGGAKFKLVSEGSMTPDQYEKFVGDLTNFMTYAAEPIRYKRQQLGIKVLMFLFVFTVLAYFLKKEFWKDVH